MDTVELRMRFRWRHEWVLAGLIVVLIATADWLVPGFAAWRTQVYFSRHLWEFAVLALGMTLIILTGGIDLSVGSTMGLCAVVFGIVVQQTGQLGWACCGCLLTGVVCGAANGWLVSRCRVHPLIVTLATFALFRGMAEGISQGASYSRFGDRFAQLARGNWLGLPWPAWGFLVLASTLAIMLGKSPAGRAIYAIGHNEMAARFSGVRVGRIKCALYILSGLLAGVVTLVYVARFDSAKADVGKGFELDVITAVVVGGTSIFGGRGNLMGTSLGLILIHETRLLVSRYWQMEELKAVVVGALLVGSVLLYQFMAKPPRDGTR